MNIRIKKSRDADKSKITYYENLIKNNPEREFIKVFSNREISGTKGKRPGFQRMFKVCRDGEIEHKYIRFQRRSSNVLCRKKPSSNYR